MIIIVLASSQGSLYEWVLEHRLHHEHFGTEKDPFNPSRGFAFAHFTNKLVSSHPDHEKLLKTIDVSDLDRDPVVVWQKRYERFQFNFHQSSDLRNLS